MLISSHKYFVNLFSHLLASGDPDGGGDCHGQQPAQAGTDEIFCIDNVEHFKDCLENDDEEHHQVEDAERHEASVQGDKLYMMVEAM